MFTYSGNPSSSKLDELRFKIGDTDEDFVLLNDDEIKFLLTSNNNDVMNTAIAAVRVIIAKLAKEVDYQIGPEKVYASDRRTQYIELLTTLIQEKSNKIAYIITSDQCEHYPNFSIGMQDNPQWIHK